MVSNDKNQRIIEIIVTFAELVGQDVSEMALGVYVRALSRYSVESINKASDKLLATRKWLKIPLPADFIELIDPPEKKEVQANLAWQTALHAIRVYGMYQTVKFQDPVIYQVIQGLGGWLSFCNSTEELHWQKKEFEKLYLDYSESDHSRNEILLGLFDAQNGVEKPQIAYVFCKYTESERKQISGPDQKLPQKTV